ncbi:MAG: phospholipase D-like domain-containing protein, partial [Elusimicrobiales bacterium]|nr:phospholipase D-like domain-containing protein [Elusimicrobiales bacterium]
MNIVIHFFVFLNVALYGTDIVELKKDIFLPEVKASSKNTYIYTLFSNETQISKKLIEQINNTLSSLDIAIYSLSNITISDAIIQAYKRGVNVRIIIEYSKVVSNKMDPAVSKLIDAKIPIRYLRGNGMYGVMHNKIVIFDKKILMTGSYNFTVAADNNNFENVVFVYDENNVLSYLNYFETMWSKAIDVYGSSKSLVNLDLSTSLFTIISSIRTDILKLIDLSQKSIDIAVYSISDEEIYNSLKKAKDRGVKIRIITDRLQASQSQTVKKLWS